MLIRPSNAVMALVVVVVGVMLAATVFSGPAGRTAHAQTATSAISYAENGTGPVATFTATDADGDAIVWSLNGDDKERFTITGGVLAFKESPDYENPNSAEKVGTLEDKNVYKVTIRATGGSHDVVVMVTNVDEPGKVTLDRPQPQVGRDLEATLRDVDLGQTDEKWQWARSEDMEVWADIRGATSQKRSPVAEDVGMYLRATVVYEDSFGSGKTASAVTANPVEARTVANAAPSFKDQDTDGDTSSGVQVDRSVAEHSPKGTNIGKPVSASDADNDILLYSLGNVTGASGDPAARFDIDAATGQLKVKDDLNSDDDRDDATNTPISVTVTATDPSGAKSEPATVVITVTDVNEAPVFDGDSTEGAPVVAPPTMLWVTEGNTRTLRTKEDADATDAALSNTAYAITDADAGDRDNDRLVLEGADKDSFRISNTGELTVWTNHTPDHEKKSSYSITIVASSGTAENLRRVRLDVVINVTDANDGGTVELSQIEPRVGRALIATLSDPDGSVVVSGWQWARAAEADTEPRCPADATYSPITGATAASYTPVEGDIDQCLQATVTYRDSLSVVGSAGNREAKMVTKRGVQADAAANDAPKYIDQDPNTPGDQSDTTARSVAENTEEGQPIGAPVDATDADDLLLYTLGGVDAESFGIDRETGQLRTKAKLDYESKNVYMVVVTATDPAGATDSILVTINVTDVDDGATISLVTAETPPDPDPADPTPDPEEPASEENPLLESFDSNEDGAIDRDEVFATIQQFLDGDATRDEVNGVILLSLAEGDAMEKDDDSMMEDDDAMEKDDDDSMEDDDDAMEDDDSMSDDSMDDAA